MQNEWQSCSPGCHFVEAPAHPQPGLLFLIRGRLEPATIVRYQRLLLPEAGGELPVRSMTARI